jgi:3-phosphoshikimate 1-carboxyvinyltransferase
MPSHSHPPAAGRLEFLDLPAFSHMQGEIALPGSKSISIRALLLSALAQGPTRLSGVLDSDDTQVMMGALRALGIGVETTGQSAGGLIVEIDPGGPKTGTLFGDILPGEAVFGGDGFPNQQADIFVGNSGLSARTLVAVLAFAAHGNCEYKIHGVPRMHERPIGDLVDALNAIGANIEYLENKGFPPLCIRAGAIDPAKPIHVRGDVSSQFLTGLLQAGPLLSMDKTVEIVVDGDLISKPYVEMTLQMMRRFGVMVERDGWAKFTVPQNAKYVSPGDFLVEADASSASYFLAAGAIGGGPVRITGVGRESLQGDVKFAQALESMGAIVTQSAEWMEAAGPAGGLRAVDLDLNHIPDAAMTLAVCALFAEGVTTLRNIGSWRVKETDRLSAMATELRKTGAEVEEGPDYLRITPPSLLGHTITPNAAIDTYDDHRMAMCFSLLAAGGVPVRINDPGCVAKTFPDYFDRFRSIASK